MDGGFEALRKNVGGGDFLLAVVAARPHNGWRSVPALSAFSSYVASAHTLSAAASDRGNPPDPGSCACRAGQGGRLLRRLRHGGQRANAALFAVDFRAR